MHLDWRILIEIISPYRKIKTRYRENEKHGAVKTKTRFRENEKHGENENWILNKIELSFANLKYLWFVKQIFRCGISLPHE